MIVDSHHHFWDPIRRHYPWMGDALAPLKRRFGPDDLLPLLHESKVEQTVLVQAVAELAETGELLATAAAHDFIGGVVGWVDQTDGSAERSIAELRSGPGGNLLAGIRHQVQDEPDAGWLMQPAVQQSIAAASEAGLVYDLLVRVDQLPSALETARLHPRTRFVLDHVAKPRIAAGIWDREWERAMAPLANQPNVACKLSGLVTEAEWASWSAEQLEPYVRKVIEWFGPERCMFGSDWPVCLLAASYSRVFSTMRQLVGEDSAIFGATARRVYDLH